MRFRLVSAFIVGFAAFAFMTRSVQAFSVAPATIELAGVRGETVEGTIRLINDSAAERTVYLSALKTASREDGSAPVFFPYEEDHSGLPEWVVFPPSVRLSANTKTDITFSVVIPSDVASGGYYGAILFSDVPAPIVETNGATIQANVATLLLLTVEGETRIAAPLLDFTRYGNQAVSNVNDIFYRFRVQNQGNVHVAPLGVVRATDLFGRTIRQVDANPERSRVLPGVTRTFEGAFGTGKVCTFFECARLQFQTLAIGPIQVTLDATTGDSVLADSFTVWVFPWQALLSVFVLCLGVFLLFRVVLRKSPPSS